ncbi:MAG: hypothetical protein GMKNLPBB_00619 [Myxococcota bacterium]|nr:hypothetical protein [Myxococcota bacterium]
MEKWLKDYFWTLELVLLTLAALICARMVTGWMGAQLRVIPGSSPPKTANLAIPSGSNISSAALDKFKSMNFLNIFVPAPEPEIKEPNGLDGTAASTAPAEDTPGGTCTHSTLRVSLVGVIYSPGNDRLSYATLVDSGSKDTYVVRKGDKVLEEATVHAVEYERVKVERAGRIECIEWEKEGVEKPPPAPVITSSIATPVQEQAEDPIAAGVQKTGDNAWTIEKKVIDDITTNFSSIATQARVIPSFENGKPSGFKFFSVRPGSVYSKMGIQSGDIVKKINGYEVNSPDKALEIYTKLREMNNVTIDVMRDGKPSTYKYTIR